MKKRKIKMTELKVESFITISKDIQNAVKGGSAVFCDAQTGKCICSRSCND